MTAAQRMHAQSAAQTRVEMLLRQLRRKFGELPEAAEAAIHEADDERVQEWLDLVVTDMSLEEMFELTPA